MDNAIHGYADMQRKAYTISPHTKRKKIGFNLGFVDHKRVTVKVTDLVTRKKRKKRKEKEKRVS